MRKPSPARVLDLMGPWPWYLLLAERLALSLFVLIVLLYLPFVAKDRRDRLRAAATGR